MGSREFERFGVRVIHFSGNCAGKAAVDEGETERDQRKTEELPPGQPLVQEEGAENRPTTRGP